MSDNNHTAATPKLSEFFKKTEPQQSAEPKKQTLEQIFQQSEAQEILNRPFERLITQNEIKSVFDANPQIRDRIKELTGYDIMDAPTDCLQYWRSNREEFADFFLIARPSRMDKHPLVAVQLKMVDGKLAAPLELENVTFSEHLDVGLNWYTREYPGGFWNWLRFAVIDAKRVAEATKRAREDAEERARQKEALRKKRVEYLRAFRSRFHFEVNKLVASLHQRPTCEINVLQSATSTVVTNITYKEMLVFLAAIRRDVNYHAMHRKGAVAELESVIRAVTDMQTYLTDGDTDIGFEFDFAHGILDFSIVNRVEDNEEIFKRNLAFIDFPMKVDAELFD